MWNLILEYSTLWTLNFEPANHQHKTTAVVPADRAKLAITLSPGKVKSSHHLEKGKSDCP
jgi:hypothetical protein